MLPERNKALVTEFYEIASDRRNVEAVDKYLGAYRQHNPTIEDGVEGLKKYLHWIQSNFPESRSTILRVIGESDTVVLHVHRVRTPGTRGDAIVDLFRVENGKIVEHWDVIQPIPEYTANGHTMFY
ncbi:ester cyclase [Bradyrhizobium sp. Tv2a-2]|uniref:nuclear transport factor 2 family protein n=1 Tax=Bradyrhizobium sp. Tv2a-2 TaxID=113395 RepID=UPI000A03B20D|nr:ester cyclase [Bradyrhizobium sp. Tv2a-2]